jgi:hypothetical protein
MFSEALREIGIPYLVFGVLDAQIEARRTAAETLDVVWFCSVAAVSVVIWCVGAWLTPLKE